MKTCNRFAEKKKYCPICKKKTKRFLNGNCVPCSAAKGRAGDYEDYCPSCKKRTMHFAGGQCMSCVKKEKEFCPVCGAEKYVQKECPACKKKRKDEEKEKAIIAQGKATKGAIRLEEYKQIEGHEIRRNYDGRGIDLIILPFDYSKIKVFFPSNYGVCKRCGRPYKGVGANQKTGSCSYCFEFAKCKFCGVEYIPKDGKFAENTGFFCSHSHTAFYSHKNNLIDISKFAEKFGPKRFLSGMSKLTVKETQKRLLKYKKEYLKNLIISDLDDLEDALSEYRDSSICWQVMSGEDVIYSAQTEKFKNEKPHMVAILTGAWAGKRNREKVMEHHDLYVRVSHVIDNKNIGIRLAIEGLYDYVAKIQAYSHEYSLVDEDKMNYLYRKINVKPERSF